MTTHQATVLLFDLALIVVVTRLFGSLATRFGQPAVIGEVAGGILLGPTLIGATLSETLFPTDVRPFLAALANLGVALFMFVVGLELDQGLVRGKLRVALSVSAGSMLLPLGLGMLLALYLFRHHPTGDRLGFILFMGAAMSVTAFPVLARILTDRGLHRGVIGGLALASAAIADVLAWSLLAVVVAMVSGAMQWQLVLTVPYLLVMFAFVRPVLRRLVGGERTPARTRFAVVLVGLLLSGALTEYFGLHFIFGAFLFGVVMPRGTLLREDILGPVEQVSMTLLLPVYFVVAGLKVDLSGIDAIGILDLSLILLVAVLSKFAGAFAGARLQGVGARDAAVLGTLMNTRGLTELVILTVGLQLGVLDTTLYSLMVVMALVTTGMAGPMLHLIGRKPASDPELDRATSVQ
ncbi:MAG TPA: cation:proton antiporter [Actinophytocola sp.]|uniref:cation:proton antiporter domain-containing protein n=1 Tax=Actinophytocola sp. TaxID=1872138 RepID=UPI002DBE8AA6|nr:cation:proton antiporter [Actinophytocola sp.]HEU5470524.1 cation:proton antiporter [Actinophytocola sp.]